MYTALTLFSFAAAAHVSKEASIIDEFDEFCSLQAGINLKVSRRKDLPALRKPPPNVTLANDTIELDRLIVPPSVQPCWDAFQDLSLSLRRDLDEPGLMCSSIWDTENRVSLADKRKHEFPTRHVEISEDSHKQRVHVFSVGPESSGTTFVARFAAQALGLDWSEFHHPTDQTINADAALWHISFPEGETCGQEYVEPILDDFGVSIPKRPRRFYINNSEVVKSYRGRNETVKILQVARNPVVSLRSKMRHNHCGSREVSLIEQDMAFKILLEAMSLPEVATICYEEILVKGRDYLIEKLASLGIDAEKGAQFPAIRTGQTNVDLGQNFVCDQQVRAYMQLCPDSPDTELLQMRCDEAGDRKSVV